METCFRGEVSGDIARMAEEEFFGLLAQDEKVVAWLVDTSGVTGFTTNIGPAGTHFVKRFKAQGGKFMIVVIKNAAVRMMAQSIALASSIKMEIFDSRELALAHLIKHVLPKLEGSSP
jgi:hypothetical protein